MVKELTITQTQYEEALMRFKINDPLDPVLVDDRSLSGEITTLVKYDEEHVLLQKICGRDVDYNIITNADFFSGKHIASHVNKF